MSKVKNKYSVYVLCLIKTNAYLKNKLNPIESPLDEGLFVGIKEV